MEVVLGSDHRGFELKNRIAEWLRQRGETVLDLGPNSADRADYPDYASTVAHQVADHPTERGILVCSSGIGMSIAANKVPGIRAALCFNSELASLARRHNNANVLCLSADFVDPDTNLSIVKAWIETPFEGGRHQTRLDKVRAMEDQNACQTKDPC